MMRPLQSSQNVTPWVMRLADAIVRYRWVWVCVCVVVTAVLGYHATRLEIDAGFEKQIPLQHPYMKTLAKYRDTLGGANQVMVALIRREGDIFDAPFLSTLKEVSDAVFFIPGVDRASVRSLFTPNARYLEIIESGFRGGNIVPSTYRGTPQDIAQVRQNVLRSNGMGHWVANDLRGAMVSAHLMEIDPVSGQKLDYVQVARLLEQMRVRYARDGIDMHVIGFAKAVGDLTDGVREVLRFFVVAFALTALLLLMYCRSWVLTVLALVVALLPVVWLLGLLPILGYGMDPMSVLVPFLIFAIGVSHAVQMTHAWQLEYQEGANGAQAAREAFVKLFAPGALALLANALGFLVIMVIEIDIVRELGITAGLGVVLMIVTNKVLLPALLSWLRVARARRPVTRGFAAQKVWWTLSKLSERRQSLWVLLLTTVVLLAGAWQASALQTGDLGKGLPELRADTRYNQDSMAITKHFSVGMDVFSVLVQTHGLEAACMDYEVMHSIERFEQHMRRVPGVRSVVALPDLAKHANQAMNEGHIKWRTLPRHPQSLAQATSAVHSNSGLLDSDCNVMQIQVFTQDHQGITIARIVQAAKEAARTLNSPKITFLLAGGNVGVMAATNEAVDSAEYQMLLALFGAISLLCLLVFRSVRATLCIVLPLVLVSVLCNALMALLDIGLKVSTLPVIALGVGVGVDYGIYLYGALRSGLARGRSLRRAFKEAYQARGSAIAFTAMAMSVGVATWAFSDLKFQADMGLLLAFMFLVNMLAALLLLPALAAWALSAKKPGRDVECVTAY